MYISIFSNIIVCILRVPGVTSITFVNYDCNVTLQFHAPWRLLSAASATFLNWHGLCKVYRTRSHRVHSDARRTKELGNGSRQPGEECPGVSLNTFAVIHLNGRTWSRHGAPLCRAVPIFARGARRRRSSPGRTACGSNTVEANNDVVFDAEQNYLTARYFRR